MTEASAEGRLRLVLGLGNPGDEYRDTRHNLGFRVLDGLASELATGRRSLSCGALVAARDDVMLAWPQTFMNRAGHAARCLAEKHDLEPSDVLVVYDDVALPLGTLRARSGGGPGGHRGMESVIRGLSSDRVARLRLGILPPDGRLADADLSDFVLTRFAPGELDEVEEMVTRAVEACRSWLEEGIEATMTRFN